MEQKDNMLEEKRIEENIMGTLPVRRLLLTMAWPMVLSMFIQGCYNIVDSIFVAYVSQDAFIALTLVFPIQTLLVSVNVGIGVGINALLSRRLGEGRYDDANAVAAHAYVIYLAFGVLCAVVGVYFARPFMELFSENTAVIEYGTVYLRIITLFAWGVCLQFAGERMMQATGNPIWNMYIQASGAVINLVMDPILIFGWFGFPALGIAGAALATVIGQSCGALIGIYLVRRHVRQIHVSFRHFRLRMDIIGPVFRVGAPAIVVQSLSTFMSLGLNKIFGLYSETYVAVLGAYFKLQNFIYMVVYGLGNAVVPMIAFNCGAHSRARVAGIGCGALPLPSGFCAHSRARVAGIIRSAMAAAIVSMLAGMVLLLAVPGPLLGLFNLDSEALAIGIPAMRIVSLSFAAAGVSLVCSYTFQATGSNSASLVLALLRQIVILLPLAAVLLHTDPALTWWAFPIAEGVCLILALLLFRSAYRKRIAPLGA